MPDPILTPIPFDAFVADVHALADALAADRGWRPRFIVGIGRGGLTPAVFLSHATGHPLLSVDVSTRVPGFADELLVKLAGYAARGDDLLFVDDINDSGRTLATLRSALHDAGAPSSRLRFATLLDNVRSAERVDYAARSIDRAVTKDWFVFPWEAVADRATLIEDAAEVPERIA